MVSRKKKKNNCKKIIVKHPACGIFPIDVPGGCGRSSAVSLILLLTDRDLPGCIMYRNDFCRFTARSARRSLLQLFQESQSATRYVVYYTIRASTKKVPESNIAPSAGCAAWQHKACLRHRQADLLCFDHTAKLLLHRQRQHVRQYSRRKARRIRIDQKE